MECCGNGATDDDVDTPVIEEKEEKQVELKSERPADVAVEVDGESGEGTPAPIPGDAAPVGGRPAPSRKNSVVRRASFRTQEFITKLQNENKRTKQIYMGIACFFFILCPAVAIPLGMHLSTVGEKTVDLTPTAAPTITPYPSAMPTQTPSAMPFPHPSPVPTPRPTKVSDRESNPS